jgi:HK97 family phage major capsid protein
MTLETKEALENLNVSFAEFKTINDARLSEIEAKGTAEIKEIKQAVNKLHAASARPVIGTGEMQNSDGKNIEMKKAFFDGFIRKGAEGAIRNMTLDQKALSTTVDTDGGFAVPEELDSEIEKRLSALSPIRAEANVVTIGSAKYKKLVSVGGIASGWVGETSSRTETATPTLQEIEPPLGEIYANPAATQTMLDDAYFNVENWLAEELAEEFSSKENAAFVNGNGTDKPKGFLTYTVSTDVDNSRTFGEIQVVKTGANGGFSASNPADKLIDLIFSMKASYRSGAKFYMNSNLLADIRKFKDSEGNYIWKAGIESGTPATLLGYPVVEVEDMPNKAAASLSVAFANMKRGYTVTDRMGTRILRDPFSHKPYIHFYTTKRVGGAVTNDQAIKLLQFSV